jgi:tetratricopeptide (TPR) repeat protein
MYTVTFYSYRGGVGRTTALVNVAFDLARRGRKVLLVDFDLEAPSLPMRPEAGAHLGLVEFVADYLRSGEVPDVRKYVYQVERIEKDSAEIWVMPAGRAHDPSSGDDDYWLTLRRINWKELYDHQDGFVLFETLKFQWQELLHPDYVLIDAHAGIYDRLAICTRQLPDAVVMMYTPESAYYVPDGLQRVLKDIIAESKLPSSPKIDLLTVASMVSPELVGERDFSIILYYSDECGIFLTSQVAIPLAPELLGGGFLFQSVEKSILAPSDWLFGLAKVLVVGTSPRPRLSQEYRRLANALIRCNCVQDSQGARAFLKELQIRPDPPLPDDLDDPRDSVANWISDRTRKLEEIVKNFDQDPEILAQAASCLFLQGRYARAMETLDRALEISPRSDSILWQRASYRRRLGIPGEAEDLLTLLEGGSSVASNPNRVFEIECWRDLESPELDTSPLDKSYPLEADTSFLNPHVASAFRRLRQIAPEKAQQVLEMPRVQKLFELAPYVECKQEELVYAIQSRQWQALINSLEERVGQSTPVSFSVHFYLSMAYWGSGDEARSIEVCKTARDSLLQGSDPATWLRGFDGFPPLMTDWMSLLSLIFWRAGDTDSALELLDRCDELLAKGHKGFFFSYWRFHSVSWDLFQEDCDLLRKMIQGGGRTDIRPVFLG